MTQAIDISPVGQATVEILSLFPKQGEWTEADYFRLPETNRIIELSKGKLIMTPAPTTQHQKISGKLYFSLYGYVSENNLGEVCYSPLDVRLWEGNIRQPDITFMSNEHLDRITRQFWGIPDLVIEILSESTIDVDKESKYLEYKKAGIPEYWIIDPFRQIIEVFALEGGDYITFGRWGIGKIAKSKLLDGFEVRVDEIMD